MNLINIPSPNDYFEITTNFGGDIWTFIFRWNETYNRFHVDCYLNNDIQVYSIAVLGGVFVLKNFDLGYNFYFYDLAGGNVFSGKDNTSSLIADLGVKVVMYQLTKAEALELGLIDG